MWYKFVEFLASPAMGAISFLFLLFQWYSQYAKEQSIKNSLFAVRRKLERVSFDKKVMSASKAEDLIDDVDAILATIGARPPFVDRVKETIKSVIIRNTKQQDRVLTFVR
jgi:hypothetical protein